MSEERLRAALAEMAALVTGAYCFKGRFETCGDAFCVEARTKRDVILHAALSDEPSPEWSALADESINP